MPWETGPLVPALYYVQAATLGFSAAAMPGPFQAFLIETATRRGHRAAALAALAPLLSDGPIILIATLLLSRLPGWTLPLLRLVGGAYVLYLGISALWAWRRERRRTRTHQDAPSPHTSALQAATINLLSPGVYLYWGTVSGPLLVEGWHHHPLSGVAFLALFYGVMLLASQALVLAVAKLAAISDRLTRAIQAISILLMCGFAVVYLWQGVTALLA
jgi:threonine/homoserine/homoserine lactone efflux protein